MSPRYALITTNSSDSTDIITIKDSKKLKEAIEMQALSDPDSVNNINNILIFINHQTVLVDYILQ